MACLLRYFTSLYTSIASIIKDITDANQSQPLFMTLDYVRDEFGDDFSMVEHILDPVEEQDQILPSDDQMPYSLKEIYPEMYLCG